MPIEVDNFSDDREIEFEVAGNGERGTEFDREGFGDIGEEVEDEWRGGEQGEGVRVDGSGNNICEGRENGVGYRNEDEDDDDCDDDYDYDENENDNDEENAAANCRRMQPTIDISELNLPAPPPIEPFAHQAPPHTRKIFLPQDFFSAGVCLETIDGVLVEPVPEVEEAGSLGRVFAGGSTREDWEAMAINLPRNQAMVHFGNLAQENLGIGWDTPSRFFKLFFHDEILEAMKNNTNDYARMKGAGREGHRRWKDMSVPELKIFLGLIIYMRVFKSARVGDYWRRDGIFPQHNIARFMGLNRFEQLKRFFHISPPTSNPLP